MVVTLLKALFFVRVLSSFQEIQQRCILFGTSSVSLAADSFPSRGSPLMVHSSSLPLEGKVPSVSEADEVETRASERPGHLPCGRCPKADALFFVKTMIYTKLQLKHLKIQLRNVTLRMTSAVREQMAEQRRSTTFSSVGKTSFRKPIRRSSRQICSIGFISGVYGWI